MSGQARCKVRTSGTTWVTSPSADRRSRQIESGGSVRGGEDRLGTGLARLDGMAAFDANERLTPFREGPGYGAILFDRTRLRQADPRGSTRTTGAAMRSRSGGRARRRLVRRWTVRRRGAAPLPARWLGGALSRDRHFWRGTDRVRSFAEFRLLRALLERKLPVPRPIAAFYLRDGHRYRAAILLERLDDVHSLADRAARRATARPGKKPAA